jgi:hypothetical protein
MLDEVPPGVATPTAMTTWAVLRASGERVGHGSPSSRANTSSAMFLRLPAGKVRNDSSAGGIGTPVPHCDNQVHNRFGNSNLCARSTLLRCHIHRRKYRHGEAATNLRSSSKSHPVQAGTCGNATTVGASPGGNHLRNNDEHGPPGLGRTLTSGWQLGERGKNECRFRDDRETGTSRHGKHVALMDNILSANAFVTVPKLPSNRDRGARLEYATLAMIAEMK